MVHQCFYYNIKLVIIKFTVREITVNSLIKRSDREKWVKLNLSYLFFYSSSVYAWSWKLN